MLELTINGKVYSFRFGIGFVREIDKTKSKKIEGIDNAEQNMGLQFAVAAVMDEDAVALADILDIANKSEMPRAKKTDIDRYIDECENIEELFAEVLEILKSANATKKTTTAVMELVAAERAKLTEQ